MFLMDIVRAGGETFGICPRDILSPKRTRETVMARYAIQKAMSLRGNSTTKIGTAMGRDHSTVCHALQRADKWSADDPFYKERINYLASLSGENFKH